MFEFVRTHRRLLQLLLVLLIFPSFVFFGVQGYSRFTDGTNATVAEVDGRAITQAEWDMAHQRQLERMREQMPGVDPRLFDSPEVKRDTLEGMVRERVLFAAVDALHLSVSDQRLKTVFATDPEYAALRNPDGTLNRALLEARGINPEQFVQQLRQEMALRQVVQPVTASAFGTQALVAAAADALLQRRTVQVQRFETKDYLARVNPSDADLQAYYKANEAQFRSPERAVIEYVMLDLQTLKKDVAVPEADLRKYYEENLSRYSTAQERRASHILVEAPKDAPAAQRQKARAKAEELLAQVRKNPAAFADVARQHSDDPGSAQRGGDLDFFGRGAMVKPFEDAVFAMKPGEISNIVETDFGFHIIRLAEVRGGQTRPFEQVRGEIEEEVRKQLAQRRYAEVAEQFSNTVYEQSDSLQPVIDKLKLSKQTATVQRTPAADAAGPLAHPKLLEAVFSADALQNKRNTDAIEVAPNQLVAARVTQHLPARTLPLAEVKDRVRQAVAAQQAADLARKEGEARLAELKQGGDKAAASLPAPVVVSRREPQGLPRPVIDAILRADAANLPAVVGVAQGQEGYVVARIVKVEPPALTAEEQQQLRDSYAQVYGAAETQAYLEALKRRFDAQVKARAPEATAAPSR